MERYNQKLKKRSRSLRTNMTDAEQVLWQRIRRKQIQGVQFYRQKPLLAFIVDFYCPTAKLVIELDGSQHFAEEYQTKDQERDAALTRLGLHVLRFDNRQILQETDAVLEVIDKIVEDQVRANSNPPCPPFFKVGKNSERSQPPLFFHPLPTLSG